MYMKENGNFKNLKYIIMLIIYFILFRHEGRKNGTGVYKFANGDQYEGYFEKGLR